MIIVKFARKTLQTCHLKSHEYSKSYHKKNRLFNDVGPSRKTYSKLSTTNFISSILQLQRNSEIIDRVPQTHAY